MAIPEKLKDLIDRFTLQKDSYKKADYKEARLRLEFLDPFFELLGWDVYNKQGYAESYKDVVLEDSIKIRANGKVTLRSPDYSFNIGGQRKFFVEAKQPAVNIKDHIDPAYQLRRYAWSAGLPVSILTDFEEFAVYDTSFRPKKKEPASVSRIFYCTLDEYEKHWDFLYNTFSKEAILKGSFDRFNKANKNKKGTSTVDREFLQEIEKWRLALAKNIALRNDIDSEGLNYSVGAIIDRILFLRISEDRGIEEYGQLQDIANGEDIYKKLRQLFIIADQKYNSGLFHFDEKEKGRGSHPDTITPHLNIDDKILKPILGKLYYPDSPYEFSVISADILGNVYEQFLGKVIIPKGKSATVVEKVQVKKAGGVYYTPRYVVEYIIETTLGEKLKGMTPMEVAGKTVDYTRPLRVLDPACGSGSFLIVAYQYLLDWHRDWYVENGPQNHTNAIIGKTLKAHEGGKGKTWQLTTEKKKEILLNNIYGLDIDSQAVEVTKLNLLLKVLEGENKETIQKQGTLVHERVLPDLGGNIKCGNALVGSDITRLLTKNKGKKASAGAQGLLFDKLSEAEKSKINFFDWELEWPDIFEGPDGGFDCIIGNPPYVRQEILGSGFKEYAEASFQTYAGTADLYVYFIEKSLGLLRPNGLYGIIVANKWLRATYGKALRGFLKQKRIYELIDFGDLPVFQNATTYPLILKASNEHPADFFAVKQDPILLGKDENPPLAVAVAQKKYPVSVDSLEKDGWSLSSVAEAKLLKKLRSKGIPLGEYVAGKIFYGIKTGFNKAFVIDEATKERLIAEDAKSAEIIKPFLEGKDIKRYETPLIKKWLIFLPKGITNNSRGKESPKKWLEKKYPAIFSWLIQFEEQCKKRYDQGEYWWELRACDYYQV